MNKRRTKAVTPPPGVTATMASAAPPVITGLPLPTPDPTFAYKTRISQACRKLRFSGTMQVPYLNDMTDAQALQAAAEFLESFVDVLARAADRNNAQERELDALQEQRRAIRKFLGLDDIRAAAQDVKDALRSGLRAGEREQ